MTFWRKLPLIIGLWVTGATAQQEPQSNDEPTAPSTADPGRSPGDDRGGLSGRGGADPSGSRRTYSSTIGSSIYSPMGSPIVSHLPEHPQ